MLIIVLQILTSAQLPTGVVSTIAQTLKVPGSALVGWDFVWNLMDGVVLVRLLGLEYNLEI